MKEKWEHSRENIEYLELENFRDWFHFDTDRPKKENAIVLETNFKIYKRIWITPERHASVFNLLKKLVPYQ